MRIDADMALRRLTEADHGVLSTVHPTRGVDAVPVVFATDGAHLAVPIDQVKPKAAGPLQRERNLAADPRASLLVDHWNADDWSQLWWVRAALRWAPDPAAELQDSLATVLTDKHAQYADRPFDRLLVFTIDSLSGWSATAPT